MIEQLTINHNAGQQTLNKNKCSNQTITITKHQCHRSTKINQANDTTTKSLRTVQRSEVTLKQSTDALMHKIKDHHKKFDTFNQTHSKRNNKSNIFKADQ